jgi:uncharacterized protein YegL
MKNKLNPFSLAIAAVVVLAACQRKEHNPLLGTPDPTVTGVQMFVRGVDNSQPHESSVLFQSVANGAIPMEDLKLANFAVLQDGSPLIATRYAPAGDYPFAVMLVIDRSGSMETDLSGVTRTVAANNAATLFLNNLPASAQAGLVEFDSTVKVTVPMTTNKNAVVAQVNISSVATGGGTAVYDAIIAGAEELSKATGLRLLIVLTDGDDNSSQKTPAEASAALLNIGTVAAGVIIGGDVTDTTTMQNIMAPTGGGVTTSLDPTSLVTALNAIITGPAFDKIYALTFRRRNTENNIKIYVSYGSITSSVDFSLLR